MKKTSAIIIAVFAVLIITASCVVASGVLTNKVEAADENATAEKEWHFYNNDLQKDEDKLNDYDFGPNPILENVSMEKVQEAIKGKKTTDSVKIEDIIKSFKAEDIRENQIKRIKEDPKLGAADMAWMDAMLGTRFLGVFYSAAKEQWDIAMNDASDAWIADKDAYAKATSNFEKKLKAANKLEIRYLDKGINDQMYMEPLGKNEGVPDIIVMDSDKHTGWFLVYTYVIKETKTIEVMYRIDCGYQPCNVAEIMKIKVKTKKPVVVKSASQGPDNDPGSHTKDDDPGAHTGDDDDPNAHTDKPKDKEKGTQVTPSDNKGPGKDTNGGDKSSAEKPSNSGEMNHQEYEQAMQENKEAQKSREGGEPNTPSTPTESNTNVDNNGDNGAGNGGIDKETEKSDSIVSDEKPADHWDVDMSQ